MISRGGQYNFVLGLRKIVNMISIMLSSTTILQVFEGGRNLLVVLIQRVVCCGINLLRMQAKKINLVMQ